MAAELTPAQRSTYAAIIDEILSTADLDTVSAKAIRKGLQAKVDHDLSEQKEQIKVLIMERFEKVQQEQGADANGSAFESAPTTNGASTTNGTTYEFESPSNKRKAADEERDELSGVEEKPKPKKAKKAPKPEEESDEAYARRLQAEFSASATARSTRGGGAQRKKPSSTATKKEKKPKKKSVARIGASDDSELEPSSDVDGKPEKEKKGGFHKLMNLSEPLQALVGEAQLSRPQTVKKVWAYVRERNLQDPADKRQLRCDETMRAVFKSDRVHMFTMNKILAQHLWPVEES